MAENTNTVIVNADPKDEKATKLEVWITILLGVATVLGAFAAYCAALWGGEQSSNYTKSIAHTNHANTIYLEALSDKSALNFDDMRDDIIYSEWKENMEKGDKEDADYFFSKLSEGFQKDLADNPSDVSEYEKQQLAAADSIVARFKESDETFDEADVMMQKGQDANKYGDGFTLCTVLFTVVLFFLGLASLKTKESVQKTYVILGSIILLLSIIRMVIIPFPDLF